MLSGKIITLEPKFLLVPLVVITMLSLFFKFVTLNNVPIGKEEITLLLLLILQNLFFRKYYN